MKKRTKTIYHSSLAFLITLLIISLTGFLGTGNFWGIKSVFGYGGGGGGGYSFTPPTTPVNVSSPSIDEFTNSTNSSFIILTGTRETETTIFINNTTDSVTYPSDSTWQVLRFLDMGDNNLEIYAQNNLGTKSETVLIIVTRGKSGDVCGNDDIIDDLDLACLASNWGQNWPEGDLVIDGIIDDLDLASLVSRWGT